MKELFKCTFYNFHDILPLYFRLATLVAKKCNFSYRYGITLNGLQNWNVSNGVSIPYRYGITYAHSMLFIAADDDVSIPYRYGITIYVF